MTRTRLHRDAEGDLNRLEEFLFKKSPRAAARAAMAIADAVASLRRFPERGTPYADGMRELIVPFGSAGYVIRYLVEADDVLVLRIFHALEER